MPILGTESSAPVRRPAFAYSSVASWRNLLGSWGNVIGIIFAVLLVRNVVFHDYRTEEISQLTKSGKSMEEIRARYIPETTSERREKVKHNRMTMQELVADVATMKKEVEYLKTRLDENKGDGASSTSRRNSTAQQPGGKSLDRIRFEEEEPLASEKTNAVANLRGSDEQPPSGNKVTQESMSSREFEDKGSVPEGDLLGSP